MSVEFGGGVQHNNFSTPADLFRSFHGSPH